MEKQNVVSKVFIPLTTLAAVITELVVVLAMLLITLDNIPRRTIYILPPEQIAMIEQLFLRLEYFVAVMCILGFLTGFLGMTIVLRRLLNPLRNKESAKTTMLRACLIVWLLLLSGTAIYIIATFLTYLIPYGPSNVKLVFLVKDFWLTGLLFGQSLAKIIMVLIIPLKQGYLITIGSVSNQPALIKLRCSR
jgi:hypothetical protein